MESVINQETEQPMHFNRLCLATGCFMEISNEMKKKKLTGSAMLNTLSLTLINSLIIRANTVGVIV